MGRKPLSEQVRLERRQKLIEVGRHYLAKVGYAGARMEDVAREAGVAKGLVYLEFPGKQQLLEAVVEQVLAEVSARFQKNLAGLTSPRDLLRRTLELIFLELDREPLFARLLAEDPELKALSPFKKGKMDQAKAEVASLRALFEGGIKSGEFRSGLDVEALPFVISSLRFIHFHFDSALAGLIKRERVVAALIDVFMAGLENPKSGAGSRRRKS